VSGVFVRFRYFFSESDIRNKSTYEYFHFLKNRKNIELLEQKNPETTAYNKEKTIERSNFNFSFSMVLFALLSF
jgi:hypothetical protein